MHLLLPHNSGNMYSNIPKIFRLLIISESIESSYVAVISVRRLLRIIRDIRKITRIHRDRGTSCSLMFAAIILFAST